MHDLEANLTEMHFFLLMLLYPKRNKQFASSYLQAKSVLHRETNTQFSTPVSFHFAPELLPGRMESLCAWNLEGSCTENRRPRKCVVFLD